MKELREGGGGLISSAASSFLSELLRKHFILHPSQFILHPFLLMLLAGDPQWQRYLFLAATLFLIWEIWRGWNLGAVRGLLRLAALFCAWVGGTTAAGATGTVIAFFSKVPPLIAPAVAGLTVAIGIYIAISMLAGLLFKKTEHHGGVVRWGFGVGGAVCGLIYGILLLWGGITMIRGLGACGELRLVNAGLTGRSDQNERTALFFLKLKNSLELGATGKTLKDADPLPTAFYDNIVKVSMVAGDQRALERFIEYPETLRLLSNPHVTALLQDPAFEKASQSRNILPLLRNKHVQAAMEDPQFIASLRAFNLTAALDYALEPQAPPRAPQAPPSRRSPRADAHARTNPSKPSAKPVPKPTATPSKATRP